MGYTVRLEQEIISFNESVVNAVHITAAKQVGEMSRCRAGVGFAGGGLGRGAQQQQNRTTIDDFV